MYDNSLRKVRNTARNHFVQSFKDHVIFTLSSASMHGLIHVVRSKRLLLERILWIVLVIAAFAVATQQALQAWHRYEKSPVVITIEKDFFNWEMEFPSVVICLRKKSKTASKDLKTFMAKYNISGTVKELEAYVEDLLFTTYLTYSNLEKYANGTKPDMVPTELYLELVNLTSSSLNAPTSKSKRTLVTINWPKNIEEKYVLILTEFGLCHVYHSKLSSYFDIGTFLKTKSPRPKYQSITVNYKQPEVSLNQKKIFESYLFFLSSPNDMIDITSHNYFCNSTLMIEFSLNIVEITSDDSIKDLSTAQRNCKFSYENDGLEHSPVYSHNLCRIECRINLCLQHCGCTPYYYKRLDNEPICNMTGMYCLSKYKEIVTLLDPKTDKDLCPCLQNCDYEEVIFPDFTPNQWFLDSTLTIKFDSFPKERYRRSLIFTKTDLLIQVGGLFGLFLGCSVLSLIEIPYFLTLRFIWGVFGNRSIKPQI